MNWPMWRVVMCYDSAASHQGSSSDVIFAWTPQNFRSPFVTHVSLRHSAGLYEFLYV